MTRVRDGRWRGTWHLYLVASLDAGVGHTVLLPAGRARLRDADDRRGDVPGDRDLGLRLSPHDVSKRNAKIFVPISLNNSNPFYSYPSGLSWTSATGGGEVRRRGSSRSDAFSRTAQQDAMERRSPPAGSCRAQVTVGAAERFAGEGELPVRRAIRIPRCAGSVTAPSVWWSRREPVELQ